ncbi:MAG: aspartate-semialdehyde dehydrogenase [Ignavibacteria bacterium]|jgi:aspartate-semialdehyde dehydrogenase
MNNKISVAVLGATGSVGQKFIQLLDDHPWFEITELAASKKSAGKKYSEAANWFLASPIPVRIKDMVVKECKPDLESEIVFSALDSSIAGEIETEFAEQGYYVISNSRNHRSDGDVPLVIPEVNHEHLEIIGKQNYKGFIVTNPNCSTIGMVLALKPIHDKYKIKELNVTTMQAVSGAGYPGLSSIDMIDNVVPYISGEEEKMIKEPLKIFGSIKNDSFVNEDIKISAQCNRVPVIDGHMECVQVKLENKPAKSELVDTLINFKSLPQELNLPFAPKNPIVYFEEDKYPQPKLHRDIERGMAVSVGRLRECSLFDYKFVILSHNTVRGAAGGTILIAELLKSKGYFN